MGSEVWVGFRGLGRLIFLIQLPSQIKKRTICQPVDFQKFEYRTRVVYMGFIFTACSAILLYLGDVMRTVLKVVGLVI